MMNIAYYQFSGCRILGEIIFWPAITGFTHITHQPQVVQIGSRSFRLKLVVPSHSQMMRCLGIKARRRVMGMILGLNTSILVTKCFVTPCRLNVWHNSAALQFLEYLQQPLRLRVNTESSHLKLTGASFFASFLAYITPHSGLLLQQNPSPTEPQGHLQSLRQGS